MENQTVTLNNGVQMPFVGLGTSHSGGYSHEAVVCALRDCGYRLIDTAKRYGCEEKLQLAIKESEIPREDIFLTTKLWPKDFGVGTTRKAFMESRQRLGTDYVGKNAAVGLTTTRETGNPVFLTCLSRVYFQICF